MRHLVVWRSNVIRFGKQFSCRALPTGFSEPIRRKTASEANDSRHHGGPIRAPLNPPASQQFVIDGSRQTLIGSQLCREVWPSRETNNKSSNFGSNIELKKQGNWIAGQRSESIGWLNFSLLFCWTIMNWSYFGAAQFWFSFLIDSLN